MLMTAKENGAGGKTDIPPEKWLSTKNDNYLNLHLIPIVILQKYTVSALLPAECGLGYLDP